MKKKNISYFYFKIFQWQYKMKSLFFDCNRSADFVQWEDTNWIFLNASNVHLLLSRTASWWCSNGSAYVENEARGAGGGEDMFKIM